MFCEKCGKQLNDGEVFCSECGAKVSVPDNVENATVQQNQNDAITDKTVAACDESATPQTSTTFADEGSSTEYCTNCGAVLPDGAAFCPACNNGNTAESSNMPTSPKKPFPKKLIGILALVVLLLLIIKPIYSYAKNTVTKLLTSPEKYFAYVVSSNADDYTETFAKIISDAKDNVLNGSGGESKIEFIAEDGLSDVVGEFVDYDISEYIDWLDRVSLSMNANTKDSTAAVDYKLDINKTNIGEIKLVTDLEDSGIYIGIPDYNPQYLYASTGTSYNDYGEAMDMIKSVMEALPDKSDTNKLLKKYIEVVVNSVEEVDESTETIEANGISQKVTKLTVDVDGNLIKNVSINFLKELNEDDELRNIIENIASVADADIDDFWYELEDAIEELEDMDSDFMDEDIMFELYVNGKGELAGFMLDADGNTIESYTAEKGGKFGSVMDFYVDGSSFKIEGSGKSFGKKRSGEFDIKVMGVSILSFELDSMDTELLKDGIFNGSITLKPADSVVSLLRSQLYSSDISLSALSDISLTIKSKTKSFDECDYELSVNYGDESCGKLAITSKTHSPKKVSIPDDYVDVNDSSDAEDWVRSIDFSNLTSKLSKAKLPDELISAVENLEEELEDNLTGSSYSSSYSSGYGYGY